MGDTINVTDITTALNKAQSGEQAKKRGRAGKKSDEEKQAELQERADRKAKRDAERAEKKAQRQIKKPAHMAKVEKAASKLPGLSTEASEVLDTVFDKFDATTIAAFIANVEHRMRVQATQASVGVNLNVGDRVKIVSGAPRFLGREAEVTEARRIRVHVLPVGETKPIYLMNSDVVLLASTVQPSETTEETIADVG
jgi:transcription antitermination factor NusG